VEGGPRKTSGKTAHRKALEGQKKGGGRRKGDLAHLKGAGDHNDCTGAKKKRSTTGDGKEKLTTRGRKNGEFRDQRADRDRRSARGGV